MSPAPRPPQSSVHDDEPHPLQRVWPVVAWALPIVFGAGTSVAALRYVAADLDRANVRLERITAELAERDRRLQTVEGEAKRLEADAARMQGAVDGAGHRLNRMERNIAVICAGRSIQCER